MAANKEEILEAIASMSVLEVSELVKMMEEKFGVSAAAPVAVAVAGGGGGRRRRSPLVRRENGIYCHP